MNLTRRTVLGGLAATPILGSLPTRTMADIEIGNARLTTVSDGNLVLPQGFVFDTMPQDELAPILKEFGLGTSPLTPECNISLYRDGENVVLFDVGSGPDFMPSAGHLADSLDAIGLAPEDVTHVIFTHAHPDHIWGLLDEFDDPLFADATYMMGQGEWDYWWDPETVNTIGDARAAFAVGAKRRMEAIEETVVLFDDGAELLPGISAILAPGHTPGHMCFEIRQGGDTALVVGDAIGNHHVAFERPEWRSGSDQDADLAVQSRLSLLDRLASEQIALIGFHLPGGGIGRAERRGDKFRFVAFG